MSTYSLHVFPTVPMYTETFSIRIPHNSPLTFSKVFVYHLIAEASFRNRRRNVLVRKYLKTMATNPLELSLASQFVCTADLTVYVTCF